MTQRKKVFISYSWDDNDHQEWVLNLANQLMTKFGIDVILDQFELSAGKDLTYFMENSIEIADKVLLILTPNYKTKAENRDSGVGYETSMITQEIFESPVTKVKFIPILRKGNKKISAPIFLKSKIYHQMDDDSLFINKLYELAQIIYDKPLVEKPELGNIPDFSKSDLDPVIDIANSFMNEERINNEISQILDSTVGVSLFNKEINRMNSILSEKVNLYKNSTPIPFILESDHRESSIIKALGFSVSFYWRVGFTNSTQNSLLLVRYWNGSIALTGGGVYFPGEEPEMTDEFKFSFDLDYDKNIVWKIDNESWTLDEIIQLAFSFIIEEIREEKSQKFRR